jgi:hypothetical protein
MWAHLRVRVLVRMWRRALAPSNAIEDVVRGRIHRMHETEIE